MPSGLPDCFLQLIFNETFEDELISKYTMNNWNYLNSDIFDELKKKEDNNQNNQIAFEVFEKYCMKYILRCNY